MNGFYYGVFAFLLLPSSLLLVTSLKLDFEKLVSRGHLLRQLGASNSSVFGQALARLIAPLVIAGCLAILGTIVLVSRDWYIPFLDHYVIARDIRASVGWSFAAVAAVSLFSVIVVCWLMRERRRAGVSTRPEIAPKSVAKWQVFILLALIIATNYIFSYFYHRDPGLARGLAVVGAALCLPFVRSGLRWAFETTEKFLAWHAQRRSSLSSMLAAADVQYSNAAVIRWTSALAFVCILAFQFATLSSAANREFIVASRALAQDAGSVLNVAMPSTGNELETVVSELPQDLVYLAYSEEGTLFGTCEGLEQLFGKCSGTATAVDGTTRNQLAPDAVLLGSVPSVGDLVDVSDNIYLVNTEERLNVAVVSQAFSQVFSPPAIAGSSVESQVSAGLTQQHQGRWVTYAAVICCGLIGLVAVFALTFEAFRQTRAIGVLSVFGNGQHLWNGMMFKLIGIPTMVTVCVGVFIGGLLVVAPTSSATMTPFPWSLTAWLLLGSVVVGLALSYLAAFVQTRLTRTWNSQQLRL